MYGDRYVPMSFYESIQDAQKTLHERSLTSLIWQTDLLDWLRTTTSLQAYSHFMLAYGYTKVEGSAKRQVMGQWLHDTVQAAVEKAPTYYVSGDMCEMVRLGAAELDVSEGLHDFDLPSPDGFLVFDRPMQVSGPAGGRAAADVNEGEAVQISAICWESGEVGQVDEHVLGQGEDGFDPSRSTVSAPGVKYWLFQTPHDAAVTINQGIKQDAVRRLKAAGIEIVEPVIHRDEDGNEVEWATESTMRRNQGPLNIYDFSGWSFGQVWAEIPYGDERQNGWSEEDGTFLTHPIVNQVRRILLSTWRMLQQKIVRIESNGPPRHIRRRAARYMPENGDILIIRLRREFSPRRQLEDLGESGEVWWTHRWTSRGHWRRPPNTPIDHAKTIWVSPSVKGPAHLPIIFKDKVFSLEQ